LNPVARDFEKLLVYQKAVDFADQVCTRTEQFARGYGILVDQLDRAALPISANLAEGNAGPVLSMRSCWIITSSAAGRSGLIS
jgi:hypothetical protein